MKSLAFVRQALFLSLASCLLPSLVLADPCSTSAGTLANGQSCTTSAGYSFTLLRRYVFNPSLFVTYNWEVWRDDASGKVWTDLIRNGKGGITRQYGERGRGQVGVFAYETCSNSNSFMTWLLNDLGLATTVSIPSRTAFQQMHARRGNEALPFSDQYVWTSTDASAETHPGPNWRDNYIYRMTNTNTSAGTHYKWVGWESPGMYPSTSYVRCLLN